MERESSAGGSEAWEGPREEESFAGESKAWEGVTGESIGSKGLAGRVRLGRACKGKGGALQVRVRLGKALQVRVRLGKARERKGRAL